MPMRPYLTRYNPNWIALNGGPAAHACAWSRPRSAVTPAQPEPRTERSWPRCKNQQKPRMKPQIPNSKSQENSKIQAPKEKRRTRCFGIWSLGFVWDLEFGIWDFEQLGSFPYDSTHPRLLI